MFGVMKYALAVAAVLLAASEARAQFGYGSYPGGAGGYGQYGWGGWGGGSTVQGSIARGLGNFAMGAGAYNEQTAAARSINADTAMRWNQFMFQSQMEANVREQRAMDARAKRDARSGDAIVDRITNHPLPEDIASGNALNAALDQITNPAIHSSVLRLATAKIPGRIVRDIPFFVATSAVTITLDQLTTDSGWPFALRDDQFDPERKAFSEAVKKAMVKNDEGEITPSAVRKLRESLDRLHAKFEAARPADVVQASAAEDYLKTLYGMVRMLERPDMEKVIAELDTIKETTLGSLLSFMHTFNLRFGRSQTPDQLAAYNVLYPQIDNIRDRILADAKTGGPGASAAKLPTEFLSAMSFEHLQGPHRSVPEEKK
jgi:hypothetical protein